MDYNDEIEDEEDYNQHLPKRTDAIYKEIENFQDYELTHCIVYEMAIRNKTIKAKLDECNRLWAKRENSQIMLMKKYFSKPQYLEKASALSKKIESYSKIIDELTDELINKHFIYPDNYELNDTGLENEQRISKILKQPLLNYPMNQIENQGLVISQGILKDNAKKMAINNVTTRFKRRVHDTNKINIAINMFLPEYELKAYFEHLIKNVDKIKSANALLEKNIQLTDKTKNFPKYPDPFKLADMFFIYDFVTADFEQIEQDRYQVDEEYRQEQEEINNDYTSTTRHKKTQLEELKSRYLGDKVVRKKEDIFQDLEVIFVLSDKAKKNEGNAQKHNLKSQSIKKYYYALKPYIEECRYPEFLTGESIIEEKLNEETLSQ